MGSAVAEQFDRLRAALSTRYDLDREIGRGGMAVVYRAHDRHHDRTVAIKVLRPDLASVLGPERFLREIQIEAGLQHPHILPLHDSGSADGLLYYVMPYVDGESLRDRIRQEKQLPVEDALRIAREVADALEYAHDHGVVHRDIKPGNILLSGYQPAGRGGAGGWHAIVADFGIAKALSTADPESMTASGIAIGTPEYMSPEQGSGEVEVDRRSDVYALGCVLYEMLAGEPPFTGRTAQAIIARHRQESPPRLSVVRPTLAPGIQQAVERALAKIPADRFPTAGAFAASLDPTRTTSERHAPGLWRRRLVRAAIPLVIVGALAAAAVLRVQLTRYSNNVGVVIVPFERIGGDTTVGGTAAGHVLFAEAVEWLPGVRALDGSRLLGSAGSVRATPLADLLQGAERLGGKYLVTGTMLADGDELRLAADLYSVSDGQRLVRGVDTATAESMDPAVGRLAIQSIRKLAEREQLDLGARKAVFSSTSSAAALGLLIQGQTDFWRGEYDRAAAAFAGAIEADSTCGLAYLRLSMLQGWQYEFSDAAATLDRALQLRHRLPERWVQLLEGRRAFVLGEGEKSITAFQHGVLDHPDDVDAWLGLGESLLHFAGYAGHSALQAQVALERAVALDSAFVPVYDHLVDLALYRGDSASAANYLQRMPAGDAATRVREAALLLRFASGPKRQNALERLRSADRQELSELVFIWMNARANLPLADTLASFLTTPDRSPDDRRRGAQYRLVALAAQGRWGDAVKFWQQDQGNQPFDAWMVQAHLAGFPAGKLVAPMFDWVRAQVRRRELPNFALPIWDDRHQGFQGLVARALLTGDSAEVTALLEATRQADAPTDIADPTKAALEASLEARLALLAGDTVAAVSALNRSLERIYHPYTWYYPLTSLATQRRLLAEISRARGSVAEAQRLEESFRQSWAIGDVLFASRLAAESSSGERGSVP